MDVIIDGQYDDEIKKHLLGQDFNPILITVNNENEFFNYLDDSFDLILTDYHLNESGSNSRDGDKIVREVREKNSIFTEIMFYSAQGDAAGKVELDRITFVDTKRIVGNDHYEKLISRAIKLIDLTIKKFQHVVVMRGMIMHETSSLDNQMLTIIKKALESTNINFDELAVQIYDELDALYSEKSKLVNDCRTNNKFKKLAKDPFVFSAEYKIKTLGQVLISLQKNDFSGEYKDEINSIRNKFAHAVLEKDPSTGREYFRHGESGITFDEELCRKIRKNINKYKINFDNLQNELT